MWLHHYYWLKFVLLRDMNYLYKSNVVSASLYLWYHNIYFDAWSLMQKLCFQFIKTNFSFDMNMSHDVYIWKCSFTCFWLMAFPFMLYLLQALCACCINSTPTAIMFVTFEPRKCCTKGTYQLSHNKCIMLTKKTTPY